MAHRSPNSNHPCDHITRVQWVDLTNLTHYHVLPVTFFASLSGHRDKADLDLTLGKAEIAGLFNNDMASASMFRHREPVYVYIHAKACMRHKLLCRQDQEQELDADVVPTVALSLCLRPVRIPIFECILLSLHEVFHLTRSTKPHM